jgi:hypothetical protein
MKFNFVSTLAVFAMLSGECVGAVANDELAKYTDKKSYIEGVQKEVRNAISQSKRVDQKVIKENLEKQIEAIKVFRTAQQKQTDAIETLQKVRETQSKVISAMKSALSDGNKSELRNALKALQTSQEKQADAISILKTARDKKQNAVKTLALTQRRQFIWFLISEETRNAIMRTAVKKGYSGIINNLLNAGINPNATDNKGITLTMIAAQYDENILPELIRNGTNINAKDEDGYSVLDYAYIGKIKKNVQLLISKGAKANRIKTKSY